MNEEELLNEFVESIHQAERLTFSDIDGLVDSEEDLEDYQENRINDIFDKTSKQLSMSFHELSDYYSKNH